jgi:hypothetical protein
VAAILGFEEGFAEAFAERAVEGAVEGAIEAKTPMVFASKGTVDADIEAIAVDAEYQVTMHSKYLQVVNSFAILAPFPAYQISSHISPLLQLPLPHVQP